MLIHITYVFLLLLMLYILYQSGRRLQKHYKIMSGAGIAAILAYTLNEGLRFGRGVDYNLYWKKFEDIAAGGDSKENIGFLLWEKFFATLDLPWQTCIIAMSMVYIISLLFFLRCYKDVAVWALPLFVLLSKDTVDNMVRWYLAFSFVLIGLTYMLQGEKLRKFILYSLLGCTIHYAMLPIPILFFFMWKLKKPLLSPILSIPIFFAVALFFKTEFMLHFVDLVNALTMVSEKFEHYGNNAEYWLTSGYSGRTRSSMPGMSEILFLCVIVYYGYKLVKTKGDKYVFAYNLFLIGLITKPIAMQIELVARFNAILYFFRAIVLSYILSDLFVKKTMKVVPVLQLFVVLILLNYGRTFLTKPFGNHPKRYLYVWNKGKETPDSMIQMWVETSEEHAEKVEKKQKKK